MITDETLDLAVTRGLIAPGQALAIRSLARETQASSRPEPVDDEKLRFVTGFADIFVTLGLTLFFGSAAFLLGQALPEAPTAAIVAMLAWAVAEFFTRRKRMALPSIALLVIFAGSCFLTIGLLVGGSPTSSGFVANWAGSLLEIGTGQEAIVIAGLGTAALTGLHYWRFRVPITVAAGVAALGATAVALLALVAPRLLQSALNPVLLVLGLSIFALAMWFDLSDPERVSRRTDIAFWLHLLSSPLIVHSVFQQIGAGRSVVSPAIAVEIIAVFLVLGTIAVLVDRRAMLVSGLVYAGVASGSLIRQVGITDLGLPLTLLVLGTFVLVLSAGWTPLRRFILDLLPAALAGRLPHPAAA